MSVNSAVKKKQEEAECPGMLRLDGTTLWISIYSNQWAACSSWAEQMYCAAIIRWAAQDAPHRLGDNVG